MQVSPGHDVDKDFLGKCVARLVQNAPVLLDQDDPICCRLRFLRDLKLQLRNRDALRDVQRVTCQSARHTKTRVQELRPLTRQRRRSSRARLSGRWRWAVHLEAEMALNVFLSNKHAMSERIAHFLSDALRVYHDNKSYWKALC